MTLNLTGEFEELGHKDGSTRLKLQEMLIFEIQQLGHTFIANQTFYELGFEIHTIGLLLSNFELSIGYRVFKIAKFYMHKTVSVVLDELEAVCKE